MDTLAAAVLIGLASYFVWFAFNSAPFLVPVTDRISALGRHWHHLMHCPFCLGAYPALLFSVLYVTLTQPPAAGSILLAGLIWLAASAVSGIIGSLIPEDSPS